MRARTATLSAAAPAWGSIVDLSAPDFAVNHPQVALSDDGSKATAVWSRANVSPSGTAIAPIMVRSRSATISGNVANWGATTVLSSATDSSAQPLLALSSDGQAATASWVRTVGTSHAVESSSATISGNVASWGAVSSVSGPGKFVRTHSLSLSPDGSKGVSIWSRVVGSKLVVQGASGVLSGSTQLWTASFDVTDPGLSSFDSTGVISGDGALAILGWLRLKPNRTHVARSRVAEFVHPTPTPTPVATSTPTSTPTPAPTTTPVGTLTGGVTPPTGVSNDHYVVLRIRDYPTNFRRDYFGYLLRAGDYKIVKMGKFKVRNHRGILEFHDVPPGTYRVFTVVVRTKAPKIISSMQRTIRVK